MQPLPRSPAAMSHPSSIPHSVGTSDAPVLADGRRALEQVLRRHPLRETISTAELRTAVRRLCADAHRAQLRPEQLVVAVKSAWAVLPESRARRHTPVHGDLLDRLISLCIAEYFEMQPAQTRESRVR